MIETGGNPIDRYVVLDYLSEGGMGAIYIGKKLGAGGFEKEVVLKQLLPEYTKQDEFIDLFLREARLSATLDHANIVHTIDLVAAGAEYFIVMEYLAGADLRTMIKRARRRGTRFSPAAAIYITREILAALSYAHAKRDIERRPLRLIHRDVSPSNVLLSVHGEVKLTDFGIAKAATHNSIFYKVKGKVGYMSPEQAKSEDMDHRSDLYSLAVCLYEVITGERLFVHAGLTTSAEEIYSQPIPLLSRKIPGLPADLDKIMLKALSIDPGGRFQTAGEFQEALLRCAHRNGLLTSAPELAQHLVDVCGPAGSWREDDDEPPRGGTEVYEPEEDEDEDENRDGGNAGPVSIHSLAEQANRTRRKPTMSASDLGRLQGVELTSIINMVDEDANEGASPLFNVDELGGSLQQTSAPPVANPSWQAPRPLRDSGEVIVPRSAPRSDSTGVLVGNARPRPNATSQAPALRPREGVRAKPGGQAWKWVTAFVVIAAAAAVFAYFVVLR